jgi:hypothetical protein
MYPSRVGFTGSIELEDELIWRKIIFNPIKKLNIIDTGTFEIGRLGARML